MAKEIPVEKLDEFCDLLFRALDRAGLLPTRLSEAAHSFEKYGRLLAGLLERYVQVEVAFEEWETRTLRGVKNKWQREAAYPYFQTLRRWLVDAENRLLFEGKGRKDNLNHFKRSLYGRIYTWLYPRRKLSVAYAQAHMGNDAEFEQGAITQQFADTVADIDVLHYLQHEDRQTVIADAQAFTLANASYYRAWKAGNTQSDEVEPVP